MKNLDLNELGVQEMNSKEMTENSGGLVPLAWLAILGGVALVGFIIGYTDSKEIF